MSKSNPRLYSHIQGEEKLKNGGKNMTKTNGHKKTFRIMAVLTAFLFIITLIPAEVQATTVTASLADWLPENPFEQIVKEIYNMLSWVKDTVQSIYSTLIWVRNTIIRLPRTIGNLLVDIIVAIPEYIMDFVVGIFTFLEKTTYQMSDFIENNVPDQVAVIALPSAVTLMAGGMMLFIYFVLKIKEAIPII